MAKGHGKLSNPSCRVPSSAQLEGGGGGATLPRSLEQWAARNGTAPLPPDPAPRKLKIQPHADTLATAGEDEDDIYDDVDADEHADDDGDDTFDDAFEDNAPDADDQLDLERS